MQNPTYTTVTGRLITNPARFFSGNEDGHFDALVVLDEGQVQKIEAIRQKALEEKFGDKIPAKFSDWTLREGDDPEYETSFGKKFIFPKSKSTGTKKARPPKALRKVNGEYERVSEEDGLFYSGCYVAINVNAYAWAADKAKNMQAGVTLGLNAVLFVKDGERLSSEVNDDEAFGDIADSQIDIGDDF